MDINRFHNLIKTSGTQFTITRPSTGDNFSVWVGTPGAVREQSLVTEAEQDDLQAMTCRLDFDGQLFTSPQNGDYLVNGSEEYVIQRVLPKFGPAHESWGWLILLRG